MSPSLGFSTFQTAPTPVCTPQPGGDGLQRHIGVDLTRLRVSTSARSAKESCPKKCPPSGTPARPMVLVPSARRPPMRFSGSQVAQ